MDVAAKRKLYLWLLAIGIAPFYVNGYINSHIASAPALYWAFEVSYWLLLPAVILFFLVRYGDLTPADIGFQLKIFRRRSTALVVVASILFCGIDYLVYTSAFNYFRTVLPDNGLFQYQVVVPTSGHERTLVAIYLALTAGFIEEIYFRGLIFKVCTMLPYTTVAYLVASPTLFALIHWESGAANTAAAYVSGVVGAAAFLLMRNLWPLVAGHTYTDYSWFG